MADPPIFRAFGAHVLESLELPSLQEEPRHAQGPLLRRENWGGSLISGEGGSWGVRGNVHWGGSCFCVAIVNSLRPSALILRGR